ncbi:response regulator [Legionella impletisoli]|uniref:Response regulator n=1 Tax=Legionella impletisoli TaxID=343510 RepID=A0A917NAD8_9GAMM|nr:response regulator [Legionella impletisoli]GGI82388.1 response regulator [Legionella impletisoli]
MYSTNPILLVEDDIIDQMAVQRALKELNVKNELVIQGNGEEALEYLKEFGKPSLIILDLNMPRMNGMEFLDVIKKDRLYRKIPVIVFTSSSQEGEKLKAFDKCIVGYIIKPADYKKFLDIFKCIDSYWSVSQGPII